MPIEQRLSTNYSTLTIEPINELVKIRFEYYMTVPFYKSISFSFPALIPLELSVFYALNSLTPTWLYDVRLPMMASLYRFCFLR